MKKAAAQQEPIDKRFPRVGSEESLAGSVMDDKIEAEMQSLKEIIKQQSEEIKDIKASFVQMYELFTKQQQQDKQQYKQLEEKLAAAAVKTEAAEAARDEDARKFEQKLSEERIAAARANAEALKKIEAKQAEQATKMQSDTEALKAQTTVSSQAQQERYQELLVKFNKLSTSYMGARPDEFVKLADPIIDSELLVNPHTTNEQKAIIAGRTKNLEDLVKIAGTSNAPLDLLLAVLASSIYQRADAGYRAIIDVAYAGNSNAGKIKSIKSIVESVPPPANISMLVAYKAAVIINHVTTGGGQISINSQEEANYIAHYEKSYSGTAHMVAQKVSGVESVNNLLRAIPSAVAVINARLGY